MRFVKILDQATAEKENFRDVFFIMRAWKCKESDVLRYMKRLGVQSYRIAGSPRLGLPLKTIAKYQTRMKEWSELEDEHKAESRKTT